MPGRERGLQGLAVGPWCCLSSRLVYESPWIRVHHDAVRTPGGTEGIYGRVHFRNRAVGIVPLDEEGCTWLVRQYRYVLGRYSWEIPEGGSPFSEDLLETAKRELREETGLMASDWQELLHLHLSNSVTDEEAVVFVARGLSQGEAEPEASEDIAVQRLPLAEALRWVMDGRITDAISVAALLKLGQLQPLQLP